MEFPEQLGRRRWAHSKYRGARPDIMASQKRARGGFERRAVIGPVGAAGGFPRGYWS